MGTGLEMIELTLEAKNDLVGTLLAFLVMHNSLSEHKQHLLNNIRKKNVDFDLKESLHYVVT